MRTIELICEAADCGITKERSLAPLTERAHELRRIGLSVVGRTICAKDGAGVAELIRNSTADIVAFAPHFAASAAVLSAELATASALRRRPAIVLLDTFDQSATPLLPLLPVVDRYAKKSVLHDRRGYLRPWAGGYVHTDWLERSGHDHIGNWHFGSIAVEEHLGKIVVGWGFAASRCWRRRLIMGRLLSRRWKRRHVDVHCRFSVPADAANTWYGRSRVEARLQLDQRCKSFKLTRPERVGRLRYLRELHDARVTVSPFGWGELCFRDLEAICAGSLLIKPSVDHLDISPAVYERDVCYRGCAWDFSDIGDVVERSIHDEAGTQEMIRTARARLRAYVRHGWLEDVERVFAGLGRVR